MVHRKCATGAAALGLAMMMGGCAAARRPLVVVSPDYSYYRDGGPLALGRESSAAKRTAEARSLARQLAAMRQVAATGATVARPSTRDIRLTEASPVR